MTKYTTVILAVFAAVLLTACDQFGQSTATNACDASCVRDIIREERSGESKGGETPGGDTTATEEETVVRTPASYGLVEHTDERVLAAGDVELTEISGAILRRNDRECLVWVPTGTEPSAAADLRLAKCGDWRPRS